jgi:hypothetical protein|uniref:DNA-binding protein n=1 Tax=uncultured Aquificia bacterium TaxID=453415 RepID=H5SBU6_9BACT|nr:hypothetical protein HGMM_F07F09C07 [uncultured Aquificae bacterium]
MQSNTTNIEEIIRQASGGKSLYRLALELGYPPKVLYDVVKGRKTSRKLIFMLAQHIHAFNLPYEYEKYLQRRLVENKGKKSTKHKGGRP